MVILMPIVRMISHVLAAVFNNARDFEQRWRLAAPPPSAANELQGRWVGEWISEANGHRGALRCILSKDRTGGFEALFHAKFCGGLRVCYTAPLHGQMNGSRLLLDGEMDIGKLAGGIYSYKGDANENEFTCSYRCKYDHGVFQMKPAPTETVNNK